MNLAEYRDVTYEMDKDFYRTVSWSYGLNEEHRFMPHLQYFVRRTNSSNDVDRYKRYFSLARSNQGKLFTWRYYLKILKEELRHFDTAVIMTEVQFLFFCTRSVVFGPLIKWHKIEGHRRQIWPKKKKQIYPYAYKPFSLFIKRYASETFFCSKFKINIF